MSGAPTGHRTTGLLLPHVWVSAGMTQLKWGGLDHRGWEDPLPRRPLLWGCLGTSGTVDQSSYACSPQDSWQQVFQWMRWKLHDLLWPSPRATQCHLQCTPLAGGVKVPSGLDTDSMERVSKNLWLFFKPAFYIRANIFIVQAFRFRVRQTRIWTRGQACIHGFSAHCWMPAGC